MISLVLANQYISQRFTNCVIICISIILIAFLFLFAIFQLTYILGNYYYQIISIIVLTFICVALSLFTDISIHLNAN